MDNVTDVDLNDTHETPLPMAAPTLPTPQTAQDGLHPGDFMLDEDDALHGAGEPMNVPIVEDQNDQIWEDNYEVEEHANEGLAAPESAPESASTARGASDPVFNVEDDCMADVIINPWTS